MKVEILWHSWIQSFFHIFFSNVQPKSKSGVLKSPLKCLLTVAQGDGHHGNVTLQFIPAPVTWVTSGSQTKKHQNYLNGKRA